MATVLRAPARDFMVVRQEWAAIRIQTVFRALLVITCLLLSRCYVTSSITVEQMYTEMASHHRVCHHCIQIIKTATIPAKLCKGRAPSSSTTPKSSSHWCLRRLGHQLES